jgi:hypothetical protein
MGWDFNFGLRDFSDPTFPPSRRNVARAFSPYASEAYLEIQTVKEIIFANRS